MSVVTGIFKDAGDAEQAYVNAIGRGYPDTDITVLMSEATRDRVLSRGSGSGFGLKANEEVENKSPPGELGGPKGGTMGTLAPVLAAAGVFLLLPGVGIIAAGPFAVALAAAGSVGLAGGLIGALTHWGIPAERTEKYEASIREGGILMGINTRSDEEAAQFKKLWADFGAELVHA